jgi:hypothetical protein
MAALQLDSETKKKLVDQGSFLLKQFHNANNEKSSGFESVSHRGQLAGFRFTMEAAFGKNATAEVLQGIRDNTKLEFPHIGPVNNDGTIHGVDPEADWEL